jgi:hypothetical protein
MVYMMEKNLALKYEMMGQPLQSTMDNGKETKQTLQQLRHNVYLILILIFLNFLSVS